MRRLMRLRVVLGGFGFARLLPALELELLRLIALNGMKERVVVGDAIRGERSKQKSNPARGGERFLLRRVARGKFRIVATDGSARRNPRGSTRRELERGVKIDVQWRAEFDR